MQRKRSEIPDDHSQTIQKLDEKPITLDKHRVCHYTPTLVKSGDEIA